MLYGMPKGFFARTYLLKNGNTEIGFIKMAVFKEAAEAEIEGEPYTLRREKPRRGKFTMEDGSGSIIVYAEKPSVWKDRFVVTFGEMEFELALASRWKQGFALTWNGDVVGKIEHPKIFSRKAVINLPGSLPIQVRAFIFWLVLVMWQRYAAAAAS